jgi:predicted  nucleic acid-binding Zn-ribbon protein
MNEELEAANSIIATLESEKEAITDKAVATKSELVSVKKELGSVKELFEEAEKEKVDL